MGIEEALDAIVRKAVNEEVRGALMLVRGEPSPIPPPNDLRAEEELLHLAFLGKLDVTSGTLLASEFFSPLHQELWAATEAVQSLGRPVTGPGLTAAMETAGQVVTDSMKVEIEELFIPMDITGSPGELKDRVQEKSRARRLIEWIGKMELELKLGTLSTGDAKARMAKWVSGPAPRAAGTQGTVSAIRR